MILEPLRPELCTPPPLWTPGPIRAPTPREAMGYLVSSTTNGKTTPNAESAYVDPPGFGSDVTHLWRAVDVTAEPEDTGSVASGAMSGTAGAAHSAAGGPNGHACWTFDGTGYYSVTISSAASGDLHWVLFAPTSACASNDIVWSWYDGGLDTWDRCAKSGSNFRWGFRNSYPATYQGVADEWTLLVVFRQAAGGRAIVAAEGYYEAAFNVYTMNQRPNGAARLGGYAGGGFGFAGSVVEVGHAHLGSDALRTARAADLISYCNSNYGLSLQAS